MDGKEKDKKAKVAAKQPKVTTQADEAVKDANEEEQDERNGIIPEGMDFRKFIGCGG